MSVVLVANRTLVASLAGLLCACSDGTSPDAAIDARSDRSAIDATADDVPALGDSASMPDSGADDVSSIDAAILPVDSSVADTGIADTSAADARVTDTGTATPDGGCVNPARAVHVATTGADTNDGSEARPVATINRGLALAMPGDAVLVRAGTYRELVVAPRSGSVGNPITLRGRCGERPIIDGTGLGRGVAAPALVRIEDRAHITVEGFELRSIAGIAGNFPAGIWVRGASNNITIRGNLVHSVDAEGGGRDNGAHGIAVYGTSTTPTEDILVEGNELRTMVLGPSEALVINGNVRRFTVRNNSVHDVNNIAYDFIGFEPDICRTCSQADELDRADVNRVRDGVVTGNLAFNVSSARNPAYMGTKSAGCFYVDGGGRMLIERNRAYRCDIGVELASEHARLSTRAITVRNNVLWQHDVAGIATGGYDSGTGPGGGLARDCVIVHNTIVDSSRSGWANAAILLQNRNQNNVYTSNIIVATAGHRAIEVGGTMNTGNTVDYNLIFRGGVTGIAAGSRQVNADPRFVDPAMNDFHLQAGSPAIDRAAPFDMTRDGALDADGRPRSSGAAPDIGAYER